jgi:DNA invertase Pin-like site-specific DNA recombinase
MAEGKWFGRRPKLTKHQAREALKRVEAGEPLREIALSYNVDHSTISRLKTRHAPKPSDRPGVVFSGVAIPVGRSGGATRRP